MHYSNVTARAWICRYSNVTWPLMRLRLRTKFVQNNNMENSELPLEEYFGNQWIPVTHEEPMVRKVFPYHNVMGCRSALCTYLATNATVQWKPRFVLMSTLSSFVSPEIVVMTNFVTTGDNKFDIISVFGECFSCQNEMIKVHLMISENNETTLCVMFKRSRFI